MFISPFPQVSSLLLCVLSASLTYLYCFSFDKFQKNFLQGLLASSGLSKFLFVWKYFNSQLHSWNIFPTLPPKYRILGWQLFTSSILKVYLDVLGLPWLFLRDQFSFKLSIIWRQRAFLLTCPRNFKQFVFYSFNMIYHKNIKIHLSGLSRWCSGKESACQGKRFRRLGFNTWVRKIPLRRKWQPTPVFLPAESP